MSRKIEIGKPVVILRNPIAPDLDGRCGVVRGSREDGPGLLVYGVEFEPGDVDHLHTCAGMVISGSGRLVRDEYVMEIVQ